jgi:hypothetical protein
MIGRYTTRACIRPQYVSPIYGFSNRTTCWRCWEMRPSNIRRSWRFLIPADAPPVGRSEVLGHPPADPAFPYRGHVPVGMLVQGVQPPVLGSEAPGAFLRGLLGAVSMAARPGDGRPGLVIEDRGRPFLRFASGLALHLGPGRPIAVGSEKDCRPLYRRTNHHITFMWASLDNSRGASPWMERRSATTWPRR